ncbi:MAG: hypothetical protein JNK14_21305 [Chitinophagaceae bacterium]|nr:hypothetical protein [Chitinophagaceae bacterium]
MRTIIVLTFLCFVLTGCIFQFLVADIAEKEQSKTDVSTLTPYNPNYLDNDSIEKMVQYQFLLLDSLERIQKQSGKRDLFLQRKIVEELEKYSRLLTERESTHISN